jgi:RNA polymerase sigma-70 factor (ECF subfamily)
MPSDRSTSEPRDVSIEFGRAWREHRRHLLDIGFRMLGSLSAAEDVVQEAFARLSRADRDQIDDVGGWLVVVTSRLCLDVLRSERRRPTSPAPSVVDGLRDPGPGPADRVTLDDNVRMALLRVLERLTPAERTAFVLHDVFQYPFTAIAEIVGRTPAACRQLASRARRSIAADASPSRFHVGSDEQRLVTQRFIAACTTGDVDSLLAILDPDVAGEGHVGGRVGTITVTGRAAVAERSLQFLGPDSATTLLSLPAADGDRDHVMAWRDGRVVALLTLIVHDGRVVHIDGVADPAQLAPLNDALTG